MKMRKRETKVERLCGCDGTTFNETRRQANLEPRRECVSRSCGPQSAHKDNHSVVIHREGKENGCTCARSQRYLQVHARSTLMSTKLTTRHVSNCCSHETLLHERTHSTSGSTNSCLTADAKRVWLKQLRHVKSTQQIER